MTNKKHWSLVILRNENKESQREVARVIGVSPQRYGLKEQGKAEFLCSEMKKLAEHYGVTLDELFGDKMPV